MNEKLFKRGNPGRPMGSRNKIPKRQEVVKLLNLITSDLLLNYPELSTSDKIKILSTFARLYFTEEEQEQSARIFHLTTMEYEELKKIDND